MPKFRMHGTKKFDTLKQRSLWSLYKAHMGLLRQIYPKGFWLYIFLGIATYFFYPFSISFSAKFINSVVAYYKTPAFMHVWHWNIPSPVYFAFLWFGIWIVWKIVTFFRDMYEALLWVSVYHGGVYRLILQKFYNLNLEEIQENKIFEALSRFSQYWFTQARAIHKNTVTLLGAVISLILTFFVMASEKGHYGLGWYILGASLLPLVSSAALFIQDRLYRKFVKKETNKFRIRDYLISTLLDSKTFLEKKVNNLYSRLIEKYLNLENQIVVDKQVNWKKHDVFVGIFNTFEYYLFVLLRVLLVADSIIQRVAVGTITGNLTFLNNIYTKVKSLLNNWTSIVASLRYTRDLFTILDLQGFADNSSNKITINQTAEQIRNMNRLNGSTNKIPVIEFKKLTFKFPDTDYILKNSSLKLYTGDTAFIYGRDGSGKSSLVKVLTASFRLPPKSYYIYGQPVEEYKRHSVKQIFSWTGEYFDRYFFSLKENIQLGTSNKYLNKSLYKRALEIADLYTWASKNKLLYSNRPLGKFFGEGLALPSGIWQRVAIARALYLDRPIILCDMCFTYIDQEARNIIIKRLLHYVKQTNKILIFTTEDLDFVELFDKLFIKTRTKLYKVDLSKLETRPDINEGSGSHKLN